jgi:hypothetical protein
VGEPQRDSELGYGCPREGSPVEGAGNAEPRGKTTSSGMPRAARAAAHAPQAWPAGGKVWEFRSPNLEVFVTPGEAQNPRFSDLGNLVHPVARLSIHPPIHPPQKL